MSLANIKLYLDSGAGMELKSYLMQRVEELKNIENVSEKGTTAEQSLEIKSQRRAYLKLKDIMQEIMTFSEDIKTKDPRDQYGVE